MTSKLPDTSDMIQKFFDIAQEVVDLSKLGILDANMSRLIENNIIDLFNKLHKFPKQLEEAYQQLYKSMLTQLTQEMSERMPELNPDHNVRQFLNSRLEEKEATVNKSGSKYNLDHTHIHTHNKENSRTLN